MSDTKYQYSPEELEKMKSFTSNAELTAWLRENRDDTLIESGQFQRDAFSPDILIANPNAPVAHGFAKTLTINGQNYELKSESAEGLLAAETNLYRSLFSGNAAGAAAHHEEPTHEEPEVVDAQEQLRLADLETKFHAGAISLDQYIEESGAVEKVLASRGIDVESLTAASDKAYVQSWTEATQEFINKNASWPGGQKNLNTVIALLEANPELAESEDKAGALAQCFEYMKQHNLLDTADVDRHRAISDAMATGNSFDEIKSAALRSIGRDPATNYSVRDWHRGQ
jgi:hypothetical protein